MIERVIIAGSGGQGAILLGKLLATMVMKQGREVTYFPSYGAEVRGGTAHCHVVYSDERIFSPVVETADSLMVMNQPSYDRFLSRLRPRGMLVLNSALVLKEKAADDMRVIRLPATDAAIEIGDARVANMVMLGAYRAVSDFAPRAALKEELNAFGERERKQALAELNLRAAARGEELARAQL